MRRGCVRIHRRNDQLGDGVDALCGSTIAKVIVESVCGARDKFSHLIPTSNISRTSALAPHQQGRSVDLRFVGWNRVVAWLNLIDRVRATHQAGQDTVPRAPTQQ